jgi:hypothetical protein
VHLQAEAFHPAKKRNNAGLTPRGL